VIRILLIDDHMLFRQALARLLAGQPDFEIAGECATVSEGLTCLKGTPVDVVLLDINLGLQQGGAFPGLAWEQGYRGKILVVTAGVSKLEAARLMERGCAGIVAKTERPELLIQSIRRVAAGDTILTGAGSGSVRLAASVPEPPEPLTVREREVLRNIFGGRGNKEIAMELGISEALVKSIVQQLFTKTGVRTRSALVRIAIERYWQELEKNGGAA
jgi:two-component system, NarL family, nitrate/nitrite response regulator NarL